MRGTHGGHKISREEDLYYNFEYIVTKSSQDFSVLGTLKICMYIDCYKDEDISDDLLSVFISLQEELNKENVLFFEDNNLGVIEGFKHRRYFL